MDLVGANVSAVFRHWCPAKSVIVHMGYRCCYVCTVLRHILLDVNTVRHGTVIVRRRTVEIDILLVVRQKRMTQHCKPSVDYGGDVSH